MTFQKDKNIRCNIRSNIHLVLIHSFYKMRECKIQKRLDSKTPCQFKTADEEVMRDHKIRKHKYIECNFAGCRQILKNRSSLRNHTENHTHDYLCEGCQKIFKDSGTAYTDLVKCKKNNQQQMEQQTKQKTKQETKKRLLQGRG